MKGLTFGEKLRNLRLNNGLTQEELANQLNLSRTMITKYDRGVINPNIDFVNECATFFKVNPVDLFDDNVSEMVPHSFIRLHSIISNIIFWISLSINGVYCIVGFIPLFIVEKGGNKHFSSIITGCFIQKTPVGLIAWLFSLVTLFFLILYIRCKVFQKKMVLSVINKALFVITFILIFLSIFYGVLGALYFESVN